MFGTLFLNGLFSGTLWLQIGWPFGGRPCELVTEAVVLLGTTTLEFTRPGQLQRLFDIPNRAAIPKT